jgi:hypothetical protein
MTTNAKPAETAPPLWTAMTPRMFDTAAKPVQEALFAEPDKFGTPDMFGDWA